MDETQPPKSCLEGYRALDLTDEKGCFCTKFLADLGADVIKVEKPGGDSTRRIGPFYHDIPDPEKSLFWFFLKANMRSVTLDIETADGREIFKRLIKGADFLVESFPPGYLDKLGLGYSALSKINPRLIVTSITSFGQKGPYKNYKGSDMVADAMGGGLSLRGYLDRPPTRDVNLGTYAQAGVQAAAGTMMAHYYRGVSGQGQQVDVSIQESVAISLGNAPGFWDLNNVIVKRRGIGIGRIVQGVKTQRKFYFPCKDGYTHVFMSGEWFEQIVKWLDSEGMAQDLTDKKWIDKSLETPKSSPLTQEEVDHQEQVAGDFLMKYTKAELYREAQARRLGWGPVNTIGEQLDNEQLRSRDDFVNIEHPELGTSLLYPRAFAKLSETSCGTYRRAPLIGEHNTEIYENELGLTRNELILLKQSGAI